MLREGLAIREKVTSDDWRRFHTMSQLGEALLGQGRHAEAESLIVSGYEGMKARERGSPRGRGPGCPRRLGGRCNSTRPGAGPRRPPSGGWGSAWPTCPPTSSPGRERPDGGSKGRESCPMSLGRAVVNNQRDARLELFRAPEGRPSIARGDNPRKRRRSTPSADLVRSPEGATVAP